MPALPPPAEVAVGDWLAIDDNAVVAVLPRTSLPVRNRIASWRELAFQARRTDHRLRAEERARWKAVTSSNRDRPART